MFFVCVFSFSAMYESVEKLFIFYFFRFTAYQGLGFNTLFIQYYSVICRPSVTTVGRPGRDSNPGRTN